MSGSSVMVLVRFLILCQMLYFNLNWLDGRPPLGRLLLARVLVCSFCDSVECQFVFPNFVFSRRLLF